MSILYITLMILSNGILTLMAERVMSIFFEKRRTPLLIFVFSYLFYWASSSLIILFYPDNPSVPWWIVLVFILQMAIISLNYESGMRHRIAAAAGYYFIMMAMDSILGLLMDIFYIETIENNTTASLFLFLSTLVSYFIVLLLFSRFKNIKKITPNLQKIWLAFSFFPIVSMIFNNFTLINSLISGAIRHLLISAGLAYIIFYVYNYLSKAFKESIKSALHTQEKEYYFAQCQLMKESAEKVKSIHHDMKLHLTTVRDYTANNKYDEALDYLGNLLGEIGEIENYSDSGNIAFDSIINYKLKDAADEGIKLDIGVSIPPALNIEVADVVTIIGNLLDNALDAVAKTEDKKIKLSIESIKGNLFITAENTFDGEVHYEPCESGTGEIIATLKEAGEHGHGLKNIRKSVEKYDGHMDITHEGNIFTVGILLYLQGA